MTTFTYVYFSLNIFSIVFGILLYRDIETHLQRDIFTGKKQITIGHLVSLLVFPAFWVTTFIIYFFQNARIIKFLLSLLEKGVETIVNFVVLMFSTPIYKSRTRKS